VVGHEVEQNLKPPLMGLHEQIVEVCQRAEAWIDVAIVGDVVAEINHRRRVDGGDPDRVDPKADKIFEPPPDPREIADAVVVGVLKGTWVDLINHTHLPPERGHAKANPCGEKQLSACCDWKSTVFLQISYFGPVRTVAGLRARTNVRFARRPLRTSNLTLRWSIL
jgi:hypothetical protein